MSFSSWTASTRGVAAEAGPTAARATPIAASRGSARRNARFMVVKMPLRITLVPRERGHDGRGTPYGETRYRRIRRVSARSGDGVGELRRVVAGHSGGGLASA